MGNKIRMALVAFHILMIGVVNMTTLILIQQVCVVYAEEDDTNLKMASD